MSIPVILSICGRQTYMDQEPEVIELITEGSMEGFMGEILEINHEKRKVSVMVTMFGGREMQVEFDFYQIEPLE